MASGVIYRLAFDPRAETELTHLRDEYESVRGGLGTLILSELDHAVTLLLAMPRLYQTVDGNIRRVPLRRFPVKIYYWIDEATGTIHIIGALADRADPATMERTIANRNS